MQKYRFDTEQIQPDGARVQYANWMAGPTLSGVKHCRWQSLAGEPRVTAYAMGHADTFFSVPAICSYKGKRVRGYLTTEDDGNIVFHHCLY